jgi:hypothetical protein
MYPGITYTASLWYQTGPSGAANWSNLSIMIGTSQSPNGLSTIATTGGAAVSANYKGLGNVFTVSQPGIYYVAVRATGNAGNAINLSWDDLRIDIPCTASLNPISGNVSANSTSVCLGNNITLTAGGGDTYLWSNGQTGNVMTAQPTSNTLYTVTITNSLTGCSVTVPQHITVNPSPIMMISTTAPAVCPGKQVGLNVGGAQSYTWTNNTFGPSTIVSPTVTTTYQVMGTNAFNCTGLAAITVSVHPLPNVIGNAVPQVVCVGEPVTFNGTGAATYQWVSNQNFVQLGNPVVAFPTTSGNYTLTGTDNNGCSKSAQVVIGVETCAGISEAKTAGLRVYPNPTTGALTIETGNGLNKTLVVTDVTGRVVMTSSSDLNNVTINMSTLSNGVYYVKVQSEAGVSISRIVKQ